MNKLFIRAGEMAEWLNASDLKLDKLKKFREFESHSLLVIPSIFGKMLQFIKSSLEEKKYYK